MAPMKSEDHDKKGEWEKDDEPMYYMENGLMVFTQAFHLKRGYCCKSGCRHCPFGGNASSDASVTPDIN
jgi:hypothetical protein